MTREEVLKTAQTCVCGNREDDYGSPENNFQRIATMWSSYMGLDSEHVLKPYDVAAMLAILKIARIASKGHGKADNWVDLAGYAACGGELQQFEEAV